MITVLMGGQYGSEGKGKIAAHLAPQMIAAVRTGGPNAGHSFELNGKMVKVQSVPSTIGNPKCIMIIGAGAVVEPELLLREIHEFGLEDRIQIDPAAVVIDAIHRDKEAQLKTAIGSTGKGVGAALADRCMRNARRIGDCKEFGRWLNDTAISINALSNVGRVLLEGTQGFGLSLIHGPYPYVTARDTSAAAVCADAGVSPRSVEEIILVVRTFPIRVGGNSGPLRKETSWDVVSAYGNSPEPLIEYTTVTNKVRRVALYDHDVVDRAVTLNRPTAIAVTFADYIDASNRGATHWENLSVRTRAWIESLERSTAVPVRWIGTGPRAEELVIR